MKRIGILLFAVSLSCVASLRASEVDFHSDPILQVAESAIQRHGEAAERIHYAEGDTFELVDISNGLNGTKSVTFERRHLGILVKGDIVRLVYRADGTLGWAASTIDEPIQISDVSPRASHAIAEKQALARFPYKSGKLRQSAELVIYCSASIKPVLAWSVRVDGIQEDGTPSHMMFYFSTDGENLLGSGDDVKTIRSSRSGSRMPSEPQAIYGVKKSEQVAVVDQTSKYTDAIGQGNTFYSGAQQIHAALNSTDNLYYLRDLTRGGNYVRNNTKEYQEDANSWGSGSLKNPETVAADAEYIHEKTWDYFKNSFNYLGYDSHGLSGVSWVHYPGGNGNPYPNAAFTLADGATKGIPVDTPEIIYGDGGPGENPFVALDVNAHEFTHGIAHYKTDFQLNQATGEVGGVDEGMADVFGAMIKFYGGDTHYVADYELGTRVFVHGGALASLQLPSNYDANDCAYPADAGLDRHVLRGPVGHAFYIFAEGATQTKVCALSDKKKATLTSDIQGVGRDEAQKIFFNALTTYMTKTKGFLDARQATLDSASALYGSSSNEYKTLDLAWMLVNVTTFNKYDFPFPTQQFVDRPIKLSAVVHQYGGSASQLAFSSQYVWKGVAYGERYYVRITTGCKSDCMMASVKECDVHFLPFTGSNLSVYESIPMISPGVYEGTIIVTADQPLPCKVVDWSGWDMRLTVSTNNQRETLPFAADYEMTIQKL